MDKSDLFSFFLSIKDNNTVDEIHTMFMENNYEINKLDINRIYRYLCIPN